MLADRLNLRNALCKHRFFYIRDRSKRQIPVVFGFQQFLDSFVSYLAGYPCFDVLSHFRCDFSSWACGKHHVIRINTFSFAACRQDFIGIRESNIMELGIHESPGSHYRLIRRIDETGKGTGQENVLIGRQGQPILLEPDRDLV